MKVTIIKGPLFEQQEKIAYEYLYHIIKKRILEEKRKTNEPTIRRNKEENT